MVHEWFENEISDAQMEDQNSLWLLFINDLDKGAGRASDKLLFRNLADSQIYVGHCHML